MGVLFLSMVERIIDTFFFCWHAIFWRDDLT